MDLKNVFKSRQSLQKCAQDLLQGLNMLKVIVQGDSADLVESLKQKIEENLNITDMELPFETERKIRDIIRIRRNILNFFLTCTLNRRYCNSGAFLHNKYLLNSKFDSSILSIGEAKGTNKIYNTHAVLCDLIKIARFSKNAIDNESLKAVLGIHIVGM